MFDMLGVIFYEQRSMATKFELIGVPMGSLWMLVAGFLFGCMGVFVKLGAAHFSHVELVFYRSFLGLLMVYLIMRQQHISVPTQHWRSHLLRGLSGDRKSTRLNSSH